MLGVVRNIVLKRRQKEITRAYPDARIILHRDMPISSLNRMTELAGKVVLVNEYEKKVKAMSDAQMRERTGELRAQVAAKNAEVEGHLVGLREAFELATIQEEKDRVKEKLKLRRNEIFAAFLPESFALVREASVRVTGMRHFDVQIAGGIVLHEGRIAEMATGEGKTLVATLPAYLNALLGKGVHVVTVNDYLARRDREWMGPIYEFLGLSVGVIQHEMSDDQRKVAYGCDITYGTNNEFGFDYLRDNMKYSLQDLVQRPFYYAIVDEVDSILIDEARTPLIISGPAEESTEKYYLIDKIIPKLKGRVVLEKEEIDAKHRGEDLSKGFDYLIDEKAHTAHLTEEGEGKVCQLLKIESLHDMETIEYRHHVLQGLRAHGLYKKDVDYVVKEGKVIIVDEFTGRMMPGRRWSDGLHQAVEAKEGMRIERENQTLATITFQNYFRMYEKLAGMTGTAYTEANEFKAIYKLDVVVMPTNRPLVRINYPDCVYKTEKEKFNAVVDEIEELHKAGRPVLVGTISIDKSEYLSEMLKRRGIAHQVLNAKYHEREAQIVAQAGRYKGVTIATNMAGRGTDILLGGNPEFIARTIVRQKIAAEDSAYHEEYAKVLDQYRKETDEEHRRVVEAGGLHVLGTERHEARRIDNQLRGRCGRQGDPGSSRFFVSLHDELMRLFGSDRIALLMDRLGLEEGQVIESPLVSRSIEIAQKRVEQHNFEIRKQLLEFDNVMNKQREVIYGQRRAKLEGVHDREDTLDIAGRMLDNILAIYAADVHHDHQWSSVGIVNEVRGAFGIELVPETIGEQKLQAVKAGIFERVKECYAAKERSMGAEALRHFECMVFLQVLDAKWKDHLHAMDGLREGIGLRAYGQRDPLIEYKREAFAMFSRLVALIEEESVSTIFKVEPVRDEHMEELRGIFSTVRQELVHPQAASFEAQPATPLAPPPRPSPDPAIPGPQTEKVGRNDPCPCGATDPATGLRIKYKKCHGR
jgi:preprotein translocase subunit SecA